MSDFDSSQWADSEFSQEYRKYANDYLPDRFKLIEIVKSFFRHFIHEVDAPRVLDLGCGDGLVVHELLKSDDRISHPGGWLCRDARLCQETSCRL